MTIAGHWVLPSEVCAVYSVGRPPDRLCRSSNGCALRLAWAVFPRRNRLLLVLRSSSQLLLRRLCSHGNARKVHSHTDCALAPTRCSHPCVERTTEGINQYWEQSFSKKINRSSRDNGAARQFAFFAKLSFLRKKHSRGCYSTEFFAKLFSKASIKPRQRSGATIRFLCQAFFLAKESGQKKDHQHVRICWW